MITLDRKVNILAAAIAAVAVIGGYVGLQNKVAEHDKALALNDTRDAQQDTALTAVGNRLALKDISEARLETRLQSLDELLRELRDQLRTLNKDKG